jgi:hypothetical protein
MRAISVNGMSRRHMATACTLGKMGIGTRGNGTCVSSMVRVQKFSRTVIRIRVITGMESHMVGVSTLGRTVQLTWEISLKA